MNPKDWDKIAKNYFAELLSPFEKDVRSDLFKDIKAIKNKQNKVVLDLGCGIGNSFSYLKEFKKVIGVDFSKEMLKIAAKRKQKNVELKKADIRDLRKLPKVNVILAVNSLLFSNLKDVDLTIEQIYSKLNNNGTLIGVVPSMEAFLYQLYLTTCDEMKKKKEKNARKSALKRTQAKEYNFPFGFFTHKGRPKFYYQFEIENRLKKSGFKNIKIGKVEYPWEIVDAPRFPKEQRFWDWYFRAEK